MAAKQAVPPRRRRRERPERLLERYGVRPTPQRVAVLGELIEEPDDVTAQELHRRLGSGGGRIGLATVYRTLALLRDEGVVDVLSHHPGELCYRVCPDQHHHHLVCTGCHRVVELVGCDLGVGYLARQALRAGAGSRERRDAISILTAPGGSVIAHARP